ncbi:sugar transferase [Erysipelothrix rhusiopathiae]|nr:sugar transferase [Erysipelothrix rhusiopathiae]
MNRDKSLEIAVFLTDFLALLSSYLLATYLYLVVIKNNRIFLEQSFCFSLSLYIISFIISEMLTIRKNKLFLSRTNLEEIFNMIKIVMVFAITFAGTAFIMGKSVLISRGVFFVALLLFFVVGSMCRFLLRGHFFKKNANKKPKVLIITTSAQAQEGEELNKVLVGSVIDIIGYALIDADIVGTNIDGIPVVASFETLDKYVRHEAIDGVLVILNNGMLKSVENMLLEIESMGVLVHIGLSTLSNYNNGISKLNHIGDYAVLTYAETLHSEESMIIKRIIDIVGGTVGVVITIIVALFLGPIIKLESPGPVLFKQKRVGKNGRQFNIYKFRSMGVDAEARKKDLLDQNEVDGHMFKLTNDPRVTKVGKFIRATSIDELPQFLNVLKGDMSLVGTRPPTVDEFNEYKSHHKKRLSMKPGITGMWQVSGRSNITDFEEVVRLDAEYIDNYSLILDFKILAKTFVVVFAKVGSK